MVSNGSMGTSPSILVHFAPAEQAPADTRSIFLTEETVHDIEVSAIVPTAVFVINGRVKGLLTCTQSGGSNPFKLPMMLCVEQNKDPTRTVYRAHDTEIREGRSAVMIDSNQLGAPMYFGNNGFTVGW